MQKLVCTVYNIAIFVASTSESDSCTEPESNHISHSECICMLGSLMPLAAFTSCTESCNGEDAPCAVSDDLIASELSNVTWPLL